MALLVSPSLACDWSTIKKVGNIYQYSKECNLAVGKLVRDSKLSQERTDKLNKALDLKDLALSKSDERIVLWRKTSYKLEDRLIKHDKYSSAKGWLLFGSGILTTILTGWAIGQAVR